MKTLGSCVLVATLLASASSAGETSVQSVPDLQAMLVKYADAATLFYNGKPEALKRFGRTLTTSRCREQLAAPLREDGAMSAQDSTGPAPSSLAPTAPRLSSKSKRRLVATSPISCNRSIFVIAALDSQRLLNGTTV